MADMLHTARSVVARTGIFGRLAACLVLFGALSAPAAPHDAAQAEAARHERALAAARVREAAKLVEGENLAVLEEGESAQERNKAIAFSSADLVMMPAFSAIPRGDPQFAVALRCLTQAVYYEAATEPLEGQRGVAQVVLNRLRHPAYPATVCGVVYEGWNRPVCQFSFVCDGSLSRQPSMALWRRAQQVARDALTGHVETAVGSATHYHADYVLPRWAFLLGKTTQIGAHIFYRFPGGNGSARSFTNAWRGGERIPSVDRSMFQTSTEGELEGIEEAAIADILPPDPTDRRAANDIGGRLDTSTAWRLEIPMPGEGSSNLDRAMGEHEGSGEERP